MRQALRFGKFQLVGLLGTGVQLLLFWLLAKRLPEPAAMPLAVEAALLHNFVWHERFTWRDRPFDGARQRALRMFRFHAGNGAFSIAANTLLTWGLAEWLHLPGLISAAAAIALCAPANYVIADCWVFAGARMKWCPHP